MKTSPTDVADRNDYFNQVNKPVWFMYYMDDFFSLLGQYRRMELLERDRRYVEQVLHSTVHKAHRYLDVYAPDLDRHDQEMHLDFDWTIDDFVVHPGNADTAALFALYEELLLERELGKS